MAAEGFSVINRLKWVENEPSACRLRTSKTSVSLAPVSIRSGLISDRIAVCYGQRKGEPRGLIRFWAS